MGKYTIYLRRNKVNGKCYVGQTNNFKQREWQWNCLKYTYANPNIDEDRAKHGLDNWTAEVLAEADTREEAWELEQRFIADYNTLWPNGYNLAKGGGGSNGVHPSNETRQKLSEAKKGEKHPMYGVHHSDETRKKMSEVRKGICYSDETRQKMSEAKKGKHLSDEHKQKIGEGNKGKHLSDETRQKISDAHPKKQVYQYTLDGELVKIWPSTMECGRNEYSQSAISNCCNAKIKAHKGYRWSYTPL